MNKPTHYVLCEPHAIYVKEAQTFYNQGGLSKDWGKKWHPVIAKDIEDAREKGKELLPWVNTTVRKSKLSFQEIDVLRTLKQVWLLNIGLRDVEELSSCHSIGEWASCGQDAIDVARRLAKKGYLYLRYPVRLTEKGEEFLEDDPFPKHGRVIDQKGNTIRSTKELVKK